jgi:5,10-methylenetetrahydrofolate reductase
MLNGPCGGYRGSYCEIEGDCIFIKHYLRMNYETLKKNMSKIVLDHRFKIREYVPVSRRPASNMLKGILNGNKVIIYEVFSHVSTDISTLEQELRHIYSDDIVFAITDSPMGVPTINPLFLAALLRERLGSEVLVNLAMRSKDLDEVVNYISSLISSNIKNVLIVTGDWPIGKRVETRFDLDSVRGIYLARLIADLGITYDGNKILPSGNPLYVGVIINQYTEYPHIEVLRTYRKIKAGADFLIPQPIFNLNQFQKIIDMLSEIRKDFTLIPSYAIIDKPRRVYELKKLGINVDDEIVKSIIFSDIDSILETNAEIIAKIIENTTELRAIYISTYGDNKLGELFVKKLRKIM